MVKAATVAPSPDNNQPWLFRETTAGLDVYLDRARSLPSDVKSMFDMTALGAAVENAVIAASEFEMQTEVICAANDVIDQKAEQPIAQLRLRSGGDRDPLYSAIDDRCTCRKPYSSSPLPTSVQEELTASCDRFADVRVSWLSSSEDKKKFGTLIASTDALRFQHQPFHEELFRQLRFRLRDVESTRDGLDVRTLELPPGVTTVLGWLRSWSVMNTVHRLRLTSLLTVPSAISVRMSGAVAIVSVSVPTAEAFFNGGRAIQRLWLAGTNLGLSMHPLGSLPIFLLQPDPKPAFRSTIEKAKCGVDALFPKLKGRVMQLGLRVGYSKPPSYRSLRRPPTDMLIK